MERLKKLSEKDKFELSELKIDRRYVGSNLECVRVTVESGEFFEIAKDGWSDISIRIKADPIKAYRYIVTGFYDENIGEIYKVFEESCQASEYVENVASGHDLKIEHKEIEIEEDDGN